MENYDIKYILSDIKITGLTFLRGDCTIHNNCYQRHIPLIDIYESVDNSPPLFIYRDGDRLYIFIYNLNFIANIQIVEDIGIIKGYDSFFTHFYDQLSTFLNKKKICKGLKYEKI